jgi:hypothetical protein
VQRGARWQVRALGDSAIIRANKERWTLMNRTLGAMALLAMLVLCSCTTERPMSPTTAVRTYNASASEVMAALPAALAAEPMKLQVAPTQNGAMQTTWKEGYRGNFHIVRYWQERTRFEMSVVPDWQNPQTVSRVEVREETQERSNPRAEWSPGTVARPERSDELLKQIDAKIGVASAPAGDAAAAVRNATTAERAPVDLGPGREPAATAWDARNGVGVVTVSGGVVETTALVSAEARKAGLQVLYERSREKQAVLQIRKGEGPVATIVVEPRPGNLTRVTLRQPEGDGETAGPLLFQVLQAKRAGVPAK